MNTDNSYTERLRPYLNPKPIEINGNTYYIVPYYCSISAPRDEYAKISHIGGFMAIDNPKRSYVLWQGTVTNDKNVLGQVLFEIDHSYQYANIDYFVVGLPYRKQGIGGQLLKHCLSYFNELGLQHITLESLPHRKSIVLDGKEHDIDLTYYIYRKYGFMLGLPPTKGFLKMYSIGCVPMCLNLRKCDPKSLPLDLTITPKNIEEFDFDSIEQQANQLLSKKKTRTY